MDESYLSRVGAFYTFVNERENVRLRRLRGDPPPWSDDPVLRTFSFTNVKRDHDRVSTQLRAWYRENGVAPGLYDADAEGRNDEVLLNCAMARYFGVPETARCVGWLTEFRKDERDRIVHLGLQDDLRFTAAYIVPACGRSDPKYVVVADVLEQIWTVSTRVTTSPRWEDQVAILCECRGVGSFMAKEVLLDYFMATGWRPEDWTTWTPVGPGGRRGASRVRYGFESKISEREALEVIRQVYDLRHGRWEHPMALDLTDIQFAACEFDKHSRVAEGGRPKRMFRPTIDEITTRSR